ncbi:190 kDa antigen precursor [Rickettsia akari str. Hartford]|uniref:190 kDa antigen n=1 Tax=Rickettsia akari (strain Hartford) TaxID=293614 RepID=A8GM29_RICAH|nr:autotransporter domain-containing protein [Rickettsia akari]ABV74454.1 190 kDa antigen precursor [Rickettsia akari str. Hartford]
MSITGKLKSVLLTYSFIISISINLFTTGSEAAGNPPPPPPPPPLPPPGWTYQAASSNNTGSGGQTTQPESSKSTGSSKKSSSSTKIPEVHPPTTELGKRYAKLIDIHDRKQNLIIQFPKVIAYLIRQELTLQNLDTSVHNIITLFNKREDSILDNAKKIYQEFINDPYIAQFTNKNKQTGDFLDNKLFEESHEEAILRLLSLEQLDAQRKQDILSQQGNILEQLKFIKENSEILGSYGKTESTNISKKLPEELPKILSQQGDILGQLRFIKENSEILGAYGKTVSTDISKKLPKELPKILSQQGDILGQLKFINDNSEILLCGHSKAILKDKLKELSKQLDTISSNQLVGFILDENKINTNLKNVPFSAKKVREQVNNLNNEILEKIFLHDDGTITEQDLTRILQKYKETDLIKNLTKAIIYIDGNESNETVSKTLAKGLENTTPEQRGLIVDVLTHNTRIRKALITKIDRERRQERNQKLNKNTEGDPFVDALKKALVQRKSDPETIQKELERRKHETPRDLNAWDRVRQNMHNPNNQNDNPNTHDENNKGWKEDNQNAQDANNNDVDRITKAKNELEQAVNAATRKFSEMSSLLKDNTIKNATACQGYLKGAEDQLALAKEKGQELIENSVQAFKIIPKKSQDNMDDNWQNYLSPKEIIALNALSDETNTLKSKKNKAGKFTSTADASQFKAKQQKYHTLLSELQKIGIAKQQEKLVKDYVDEMLTNAKKAVGKIETTLEYLNKKKENKNDNAESSPLISKEIFEAREQLKKAEQKLERIKFKNTIAKQRKADSSDEDSDDEWDDDYDKKATKQKEELANKQKQELEDAQEEIKQAKKNLENAEVRDAERKQQEAAAKRQEELKRKQDEVNHKIVEDEVERKAENAQAERLEDMDAMFKNAKDEAEHKEKANRQRQEELKRKQDEVNRKIVEDEVKRKAENVQAERLEDMDAVFKNAKDEAEHKEKANRQRQEELKRKQDEVNRKIVEDEVERKAENAQAERLEDMDAMFKNAKDEAEYKEKANRQRQDEVNRKIVEDEVERKAENAQAERLEDMDAMFKNAKDEAEHKEKANRQRQEELKRKQDEVNHKIVEDEVERKAENAQAERLEDMDAMFKNAKDEAEHKEKANRQRQEELKRKQDEVNRKIVEDEVKRKAENVQAERLEDMDAVFKNAKDEAEHKEKANRQRQEELKRKQDEVNRKIVEDEVERKAENAQAERLEDMAAMFKNAKDEAEYKEKANRQRQDEVNRKIVEDEVERKAENAQAERLEDMDAMFKNAKDEAEHKEKANRQRQEELKRKQDEVNCKMVEDEVERKAENAEDEYLEDMAAMFKNAEDEAEYKEKANRQRQDEVNRKMVEDEVERKAENAEDEAEHKENENRQRQEEQNCQEQERKRLAAEEDEQTEKTTRKQEETEEEKLKNDIALEGEDEDIGVSFKTEAIVEQDEAAQRQQVSDDTSRKVAILVKATSTLHKPVHHNILSDRLKVSAIATGDEEPTIARGVWISGLYGMNKQGTWKNIPKYQGRTTGITIGADIEFINSHDVIGIAYSRLESKIKYNEKLGKTAVNVHLFSIYGLKELNKGFSLQAITSYGHNYIKNKSKSINNIVGKYQNNNFSFQTLLNYKYRTKDDLHFIPNIGFKYDYSRASSYKEYNVDIENLVIQKKSNQLFESSIGGKIVFKPIATISNVVLTPSLYGNIERHFNHKNTKVNAKATFKGQILQETIIIPKQPKLGYNIGSNMLMSRKNINVLLEYNYYTHRKYQSHQGLVKLKVNL